MTKLIKLSLAAALVATSVSAVEFSTKGKMEVEYDWTANSTTEKEWDLDVDVTVTGKFSDNLSGVLTVEADNEDDAQGSSLGSDDAFDVVNQYFVYSNAGATLTAGKQGVGTPFFDDERGLGVVGTYNMGAFTLAAANFTTNTTVVPTQEINAQAIMGSMNGVNYSLWLAQIANTGDAYTANVNGNLGSVSYDVRTTRVDYDADAEATLTEVKLGTTIGAYKLTAAYGTTGANNADAHGVDLTSDNDATTNFGLDGIDIDDYDSAKAFVVSASTEINGVNVTLAHLTGDNNGTDLSETQAKAAYSVAAGAKLTGKVGSKDTGSGSTSYGSMAVEFKF